MSMNCHLRCLSQFEVAAIKRNPAAATSMANTGSLRAAGRRRPSLLKNVGVLRQGGGTGVLLSPFLRRELERQIEEASAPAAARAEGDPGRLLDLHKSWHVLHYLFTGEVEGGTPPANALLGGRALGEDMGYGPPRLHEPAAAAAFARFLAPLTVSELQARIDMGRMSALGIYCCEENDEGSAEAVREDVAHYFPLLQSFVAAAANNGNGLLMWLS